MLWERVRGPRVLELGVGTGKNVPHYRDGWRVTGIDLSPRMLDQAAGRAKRAGVEVALLLGDAPALPFPDASFDTAVATFVFCSVPDPVLGLGEADRVLAPGGQPLLLEHVLSRHALLRPLMRAADPLVVRLMGAHIDRETVRNIERAGFDIRRVDDLLGDIVKAIEAERPVAPAPGRRRPRPAAGGWGARCSDRTAAAR
jgi:phosphatidylethanolamine/phosphatidyl-N-methylethanolamine N-methyltransferase